MSMSNNLQYIFGGPKYVSVSTPKTSKLANQHPQGLGTVASGQPQTIASAAAPASHTSTLTPHKPNSTAILTQRPSVALALLPSAQSAIWPSISPAQRASSSPSAGTARIRLLRSTSRTPSPERGMMAEMRLV